MRQYLQSGQLSRFATAAVSVDRAATITVNGAPQTATQVVINYPFDFIVLQSVAQLVVHGTTTGSPLTMQASALMRNEAQ